MIIITHPTPVENEIKLIHSLLEEGLDLLHVRKPDFSEEEMKRFLSEIDSEFRGRLVLHQHHQLAETFDINRIHFSRKERVQCLNNPMEVSRLFRTNKIKSTSTHHIDSFNALNYSNSFSPDALGSHPERNFEYAFLSPVYPSISKPDYVSNSKLLETVKQRTNFSTKLIALGGIIPENIKTTLENGFDDVAVLGTIWNSGNPIENFKLCQEIVLTHSL